MSGTSPDTADAARRTRHSQALDIIHGYVVASAGAGLIPLPVLDTTVLAGIHIALIKALTAHYGEKFSDHAARNITVAIGVSLVPATLGSLATRRLLRFLPYVLGPITQSA